MYILYRSKFADNMSGTFRLGERDRRRIPALRDAIEPRLCEFLNSTDQLCVGVGAAYKLETMVADLAELILLRVFTQQVDMRVKDFKLLPVPEASQSYSGIRANFRAFLDMTSDESGHKGDATLLMNKANQVFSQLVFRLNAAGLPRGLADVIGVIDAQNNANGTFESFDVLFRG